MCNALGLWVPWAISWWLTPDGRKQSRDGRCSVGDFLASLRGYNMYDRIVWRLICGSVRNRMLASVLWGFCLFLTLFPDVTVHLCSCTHIRILFVKEELITNLLQLIFNLALCTAARQQHTHSSRRTPSYTKDTICCICKGNYNIHCSWRWACKP